MFEFSAEILGLLFLAGVVAGFVDAIAGGGGLLTIPALVAAGLSPAEALATNKLQGSFGSFSAAWHFVRKGMVRPRELMPAIVATFVGAAIGTVAVQMIDAERLKDALPFLLIGIAVYMLVSPRAGDIDTAQRMRPLTFNLVLGFVLGFYDGFFGPGTGSFWAIAFVGLLGYNLTKATAHTKIVNFTSNFASLLFFILGGKVVWLVGLVMAAGQVLGARAGSGLVVRNGARIVRPLLVVMSLLITANLIWRDEEHMLHVGLAGAVAWVTDAVR